MTYDIYRYIFLGCAGLAALSLIIAVAMFFVLKIPRVIGDLSGSTARKAIEDIRNQNENSGTKTHQTSAVNRERGKITDKMTPTGTLIHNPTDTMNGAMATTKIGTSILAAEAKESYERSLGANDGSNETTVLNAEDPGATTILDQGGSNETTILAPSGAGETTVLDQNDAAPAENGENVFTIEYEITLIHTDEAIDPR